MKTVTPKPQQQTSLPSTSKANFRALEQTNIQNLPALLDRLELRLSEKISQSTNPIREQLLDIQTSLKITTQTAEAALKMGATLKSDITEIRQQVQLFPDIPQEALLIRHELKATTDKLRTASIKYRWLQSGHLQVIYQRKAYFAKDEDTGLKMLQALKLQEDMDPRRSQKRKHIPSATPEKSTKIPIREEATPEREDITDNQPEA
ncbi:UNVERIFIED_CONTAM: hypothetical protein K2H54_055267 [Gekko kuhli]